jgi:hypothetical protein
MVLVNYDSSLDFVATLPGGFGYQDLYGNVVTSLLSLPPIRGSLAAADGSAVVLLKTGASGCSQ